MSYTGIYGPLVALAGDHAPRITDAERYEHLCGTPDFSHEFSHTFDNQADLGEYQSDDYPRQSWDTLCGFRTWENDVFREYNIERLAWCYSPDTFKYFWGTVGEFCEPFRFVHSGRPSVWPRTDADDFMGDDPGFEGVVYRVTVHGSDDLTVERGVVEFGGFAEVDS